MSATTHPSAVPAEAPAADGSALTRSPSLLRAEVRRLFSRRFVRVLVLVSLLVYLAGVLYAGLTQYAKPSEAEYAQARAQVAQAQAEQKRFYEECIQQPPPEPGMSVEDYCGTPPTDSMFRAEDFMERRPFTLSGDLGPGAIAAAVGAGMVAFLIGATFVGAEWSSRSMVALLFWEPRRARVLATKMLVLAAVAVALGLGAQLLWWGLAQVLARTRGTTDVPAGFWGDQLALSGRSVLLVLMLGLLGFGISNLIRNTAAALGFGFVYFMIIENLVRGFKPPWQEWLLADNAAALVAEGGHRIYLYDDETGSSRELLISNLHGGLVLGAAVALILVAGTVLFVRRDLH